MNTFYKILGPIFFVPVIYYIYLIIKGYLYNADPISSLHILISPTYLPASSIGGVYIPLILGLLLAFTGTIFILKGFNKLPQSRQNDYKKILGVITLFFGGITIFFISLLVISNFTDYWAGGFMLLSMIPLSLSLSVWLIINVISYHSKPLTISLGVLLIIIVCYLSYIHSINTPSSTEDCEADHIYKNGCLEKLQQLVERGKK